MYEAVTVLTAVMMLQWGLLNFLLAVVVAIFALLASARGIEKLKEWYAAKHPYNDVEDGTVREPGFLSEVYKSLKDKTCVMLNLVD